MKKIILSLSLISVFNISSAQEQIIRSEKIDAYKKIYLTEKLNLDKKNESKFWEVYKLYQDSLKENYRQRRLKYRTMKLDSSNFSDKEYEQYINDFLSYEKKKIDLRAKLIVNLKEFMSLKKTSYLFRLEDDFRREMITKLKNNNKK
ncbi:MAG: hypothetical protein ISP56_01060 [Flavobacteriaceae bacterium]|nr:hypothetical protein [Flavobacteriaceae bacterium]